MTVIISKPAVNLREELASLRNQGGYEEQQFYFDSLVTNGTFDGASTTGWTIFGSPTVDASANTLDITSVSATNSGASVQLTGVSVGDDLLLTYDLVSETGNGLHYIRTYSASGIGGTDIVAIGSPTVGNGKEVLFTSSYDNPFISFFTTNVSGQQFEIDNISVFETDGTDVVHRMPKGWVPLHVYEDGLLQREGAAHDYEVVYNGFDYYVKPAVAPSATTQTCVIGVRK